MPDLPYSGSSSRVGCGHMLLDPRISQACPADTKSAIFLAQKAMYFCWSLRVVVRHQGSKREDKNGTMGICAGMRGTWGLLGGLDPVAMKSLSELKVFISLTWIMSSGKFLPVRLQL